jgi:two-component system, cell cycle response regulator
MDAKAVTQFCVAPVPMLEEDTSPDGCHAAYLIIVGGGIPGTMHPLDKRGTSLGRSIENSVQLNDITVSRRHAHVGIDPDGVFCVKDEGSTNGTFLNGHRILPHGVRRLADGDRIQLGKHVVLKLVRLDPNEARFQREMFERTVRDCLTGLYNRAYFNEQVRPLAELGGLHGNGLAILMIDVDHFKRINDEFGHIIGDSVLRDVATVIRESTRAADLVARYGGEEFVVALPVSSVELAIDRAERIRRNLGGHPIRFESEQVFVTASIGVAFGIPGRSCHARSLITGADMALYRAKSEGRNRVVLGHPDTLVPMRITESADVLLAR